MIQKNSPNFTPGRKANIKFVIVHIMEGTLNGTDNWFSQKASKVSAHYGVGFKGEQHQYVQEKDTAWHAGVVKNPTIDFKGVNPNDLSIGIECEGTDLSKAPQAQINALASLIKNICVRNNLHIDRKTIIGHYEVNPVTRANCPATDKSILDKIVKQAACPVVGSKLSVCPACGQVNPNKVA